MFTLNVYLRDCVSGFPRHIGTTVGAIRRSYFPFVSFFFEITIAYSIQLLHWNTFRNSHFFAVSFFFQYQRENWKKLKSKVRKINSLPDSQLTLVVLLNWSMPVSMVNVHYSHWNLLSAANERGKEREKNRKKEFLAYRIPKWTEINCIFFSSHSFPIQSTIFTTHLWCIDFQWILLFPFRRDL